MLQDTSERYGAISRLLHWGMALLFVWHFVGAACRAVLGKDDALASFMFSTHRPLGTLLFVLVLLRVVWALLARQHRPDYVHMRLGRWARFGHMVLYGLMVLVPALGLMRQYGSGRGFAPWGITIMETTGIRIPWMMSPANAVHGLLGWLLLILIVGHIVMAFVHHFAMRDNTLGRMWGK